MKKIKQIFAEDELEMAQDWLEEYKSFNPNSKMKIFKIQFYKFKNANKMIQVGGYAIASQSFFEAENKHYIAYNGINPI